MRYYSVILININAGLIEVWDISTPCTKKEAQRYAKNQAFAKKQFHIMYNRNQGNHRQEGFRKIQY